MRKKLYAIGVLLCALLMLGTAGAMEVGDITLKEGAWQVGVSVAGALWWWNLLRIEEIRIARRLR